MAQRINVAELRAGLEKYLAGYPAQSGERAIWKKPLLATAPADERFDALPQIAKQDHLLPRDLLPEAKSVVAFFIPFTEELVKENFGGKLPAKSWGQAYESTNKLIGLACQMLAGLLKERGWKAELTPATANFDVQSLMARWSHKHLAYLCGLGRFGHHRLLITPNGCAGRLGSLVTDAELGDNPLMETEHACLHKAGKECLLCVEHCPVAALSAEGFDRRRCWNRLVFNVEKTGALDGLDLDTHVCAKCAMDLPCTFINPLS